MRSRCAAMSCGGVLVRQMGSITGALGSLRCLIDAMRRVQAIIGELLRPFAGGIASLPRGRRPTLRRLNRSLSLPLNSVVSVAHHDRVCPALRRLIHACPPHRSVPCRSAA